MCVAEVKSLSAERTSLQSELTLTKKLIDGVRGDADLESRGIVSYRTRERLFTPQHPFPGGDTEADSYCNRDHAGNQAAGAEA